MSQTTDVAKVAEMSEADLFIAIGADLTGRPAMPVSQQELLERGQAWFERNAKKICDAVCPHAQRIIQESDMQKAIIAVADLLASIVIHVAPFKVAALVIKAGVTKLCNNQKSVVSG